MVGGLPTVVSRVTVYNKEPPKVHLELSMFKLSSCLALSTTDFSNFFSCSVTSLVQFFSYKTFSRSANNNDYSHSLRVRLIIIIKARKQLLHRVHYLSSNSGPLVLLRLRQGDRRHFKSAIRVRLLLLPRQMQAKMLCLGVMSRTMF